MTKERVARHADVSSFVLRANEIPLGNRNAPPLRFVVAWSRGRVVAWSRGQLRGRHLIGREEGQQALEQRDEMAVVTFELFRHQILVRHTVITNRP